MMRYGPLPRLLDTMVGKLATIKVSVSSKRCAGKARLEMYPENTHSCSFSPNERSLSKAAIRTIPNMRYIAGSSLKLGRRTLACALMYLMVPFGVVDLFAQSAPPPPPDMAQGGPPAQAYNPLSPDQLNQLVAPIALYPDALVAQILAASTFPNEIADADAFVQSNPGVPPDQMGQMVDGMQWDPSVKALVAFPTVLDNLNKNMNWTNALGNAYYNQPQDVMSAVQVMRQRAYDAGTLRTNQQLDVSYQPGNIVVAPANPAVVYVPYYNPWTVYGAPVVAYGAYYPPPPPPGIGLLVGEAIGFGLGVAVASWNHWGWGYHGWDVGWHDHTVVYNRNVYIPRSVTVYNHGYYGGYDRNVAARTYNANIARTAPNYRPGYNGTYPRTTAYNNSVNRTVTNNYNRTVVNNNYNRTDVNNINRSNMNNYNRPANTNNAYNRPGTPTTTITARRIQTTPTIVREPRPTTITARRIQTIPTIIRRHRLIATIAQGTRITLTIDPEIRPIITAVRRTQIIPTIIRRLTIAIAVLRRTTPIIRRQPIIAVLRRTTPIIRRAITATRLRNRTLLHRANRAAESTPIHTTNKSQLHEPIWGMEFNSIPLSLCDNRTAVISSWRMVHNPPPNRQAFGSFRGHLHLSNRRE